MSKRATLRDIINSDWVTNGGKEQVEMDKLSEEYIEGFSKDEPAGKNKLYFGNISRLASSPDARKRMGWIRGKTFKL